MLSVLMVILLLIIFAVLLVLFAAIDVVFEAKGSGTDIEHTVTVHWLLFSRLVSPTEDDDEDDEEDLPEEVRNTGKLVTERVTKHFQKPKKEKKEKRTDMSFSEMVLAFRQLRSPVLRLLKGMIHAIRIPYAKVNVAFGFSDPAYTGMVCGYVYALKGYLACHSDNLVMQLDPDFVDRRLDLAMSGTVRFRLYRFIPVILLFILNWEVLRFSWYFLIKRDSKKVKC